MKSTFIAIIAALFLIGCGNSQQASTPAEFAKLYQGYGQQTAQVNGEAWAKVYKKQIGKATVSAQSDSTVSANCLGGDGFATVKVIGKRESFSLQCQTDGNNKGEKGCLTDSDFEAKPNYIKGQCDVSITAIPKPVN